MINPLDSLYTLKSCRSKRISSFDRTGGNADRITLEAGETATLAQIGGGGIIRHIWFTVSSKDPLFRRNAVLRMYWDGEREPSVQAPIGDFFGQGWCEHYPFMSLPLAAGPKEGRALVCYFPMPFADGARITLENDSEHPVGALYYYIDYEEHDSIDAAAGRFHAWWNRELTEPVEGGENEWSTLGPTPLNPFDAGNYLIADIEGAGRFVGVNYFCHSPGPIWYGEGDDMWMIDGETWPGSLHGTGTEDFFNASWCPNELYQHPYFGYARVPQLFGWMGRTHSYRFFLEDPVHFQRSLRVSIEHGHANVLTLDLASVAYWYQAEPHRPYAPIVDRSGREPMPEITVRDVHRWRDSWRREHGAGRLWGNESQEETR